MSIKTNAATHIYILLDRSGSMQSRWTETCQAINHYVTELNGDKSDTALVTLAVFDGQASQLNFNLVTNHMPTAKWVETPIDLAPWAPRGWTPLYDAIDRIASMSEGAEKAIIVIMTDGEENSSTRTSRVQARAVLDRARAKGHQVVFLGANFDAIKQASHIGTQVAQTLNYSDGRADKTFALLGHHSNSYRASGAAINFTDADRRAVSN